MFDLDDPFFRPLWIRILLVAVALGWALVEFFTGAPFFATLFGAIGLYAGWRFFVTFNPPDDTAGNDPPA